MNARAAYYARQDSRFSVYLEEGRAFGPHGKDLVIANSILPEHYDESLSEELTDLTVSFTCFEYEVLLCGFHLV